MQHHLLGGEIRKKHLHILQRPFPHFECSCRDIQKGHSGLFTAELHSCQKIVLLLLEQLLAVGNPRGNQFCNPPFHYLFCEFGIFQLVAHRNLVTALHQFWKIGIYGMMGESGKIYRRSVAVGSFGKDNPQHLAGNSGILPESFVKVTDSEEQQRIGILSFDAEILLHQRSLNYIFLLVHKTTKIKKTPDKQSAEKRKNLLFYTFSSGLKSGVMYLMNLAGTPPTTVLASTSFETTAPAATTALSPIVTPCNMVACAPIQTPFPNLIGAWLSA